LSLITTFHSTDPAAFLAFCAASFLNLRLRFAAVHLSSAQKPFATPVTLAAASLAAFHDPTQRVVTPGNWLFV
jgi:hypothetical protein